MYLQNQATTLPGFAICTKAAAAWVWLQSVHPSSHPILLSLFSCVYQNKSSKLSFTDLISFDVHIPLGNRKITTRGVSTPGWESVLYGGGLEKAKRHYFWKGTFWISFRCKLSYCELDRWNSIHLHWIVVNKETEISKPWQVKTPNCLHG